MEKQRALRFLVHFFDVHCNDETFYGGREHATTNSLLNLDTVFTNWKAGKIGHIWLIELV